MGVLVISGCSNKVPKSGSLKQYIEFYVLHFWGLENPRSWCWSSWFLVRALFLAGSAFSAGHGGGSVGRGNGESEGSSHLPVTRPQSY